MFPCQKMRLCNIHNNNKRNRSGERTSFYPFLLMRPNIEQKVIMPELGGHVK
jgi:hypothetical protein